jgi:HEAT repeat protein
VPALVDVLKDPERDVRQCAAKALGDIGSASAPAAGALALTLGDRDWQVRRAAADALGRIGTRDGEAALKGARKDPNESVRKAARASLDRIRQLPKRKG